MRGLEFEGDDATALFLVFQTRTNDVESGLEGMGEGGEEKLDIWKVHYNHFQSVYQKG